MRRSAERHKANQKMKKHQKTRKRNEFIWYNKMVFYSVDKYVLRGFNEKECNINISGNRINAWMYTG